MGKKLFVITMLFLLIFTGCGKKEDNKDGKIFKEDLNIQFNSETKISDLLNDKSIELINGHEVIDTSKVGEQEVIIKYVKDEVELEETIIIKIVDTEVPVIQHIF